jgi:hypothetical protein
VARSKVQLDPAREPPLPVPQWQVWSIDYSREGDMVTRLVTWFDREGNKDGDIATFEMKEM